MSIKVEVLNVRELEIRFANLSEDMQNDTMKRLTEIAMTDIETGAKMSLTENGHVITGRLRASIHTEVNNRAMFDGKDARSYKVPNPKKGQSKTFDGMLSESPGKDEVYVGTNVVYARRMEALDAYLFPAFAKAKDKIIRELGDVIKRVRIR